MTLMRIHLVPLVGCLLSAIAAPALAQTGYGLDTWQGDVRLLRSGQREEQLTRQTRRSLAAADILRPQGRRSWVEIRCPGQPRSRRWEGARQSRSVSEICNPSGTVRRDTGTRTGLSDLLAIAACEFVPKTYFDPSTEQLTWPSVPGAQRYRVDWVDRDRRSPLWQTETPATQIPYGGPPLTGRLYGLTVTAITTNQQPLSTYRLDHIHPLPSDIAATWSRDRAALSTNSALMPDDQRWARADQALSIGRTASDPELWWTLLAELAPEAETKNPTVHLRLALAHLYLNRPAEARSMAARALAATGQSPSMVRAEALVMLAQAAWAGGDNPAATASLAEARSIYQRQGESSQVESIDFALAKFQRRLTDHCSP